jgi:hypothetical protein
LASSIIFMPAAVICSAAISFSTRFLFSGDHALDGLRGVKICL